VSSIEETRARVARRGVIYGIERVEQLLAEIDRLRTELAEARAERDAARKERDALQRHYDATGPEHNLLALLDLYESREREALAGEADAVRRAESAELGCEIAYRREPTQDEGDAHEDALGECFVPMGGWTGRRCRVCNRWTWGGPTACVACVSQEEAVLALGRAWMHGGATLAEGIRRKTTAMERLAQPKKRKRPCATLTVEYVDDSAETTTYGGDK